MNIYRILSKVNDARAVRRAVQQRSARPIVKRVVRKNVYRVEGKLTRKLLRKIGM